MRTKFDKIAFFAMILLSFSIPVSTAMTTISAGIILLCWGLSGDYNKKLSIFIAHPLSRSLIGLVLISLVCFKLSSVPLEDSMDRLKDILRLMLIPVLIYYISDKRTVNAILWAFVAAMTLTLIAAILKVYCDVPIGMKYTEAAVFKSHIKSNFFMAIATFIVLYKAKFHPHLAKYGVPLAFAMAYYVIFMSVGRIGYVVFAMLAIYLSYLSMGKKGILLTSIVVMCMLGGAYLASDSFKNRIDILSQDWDYYQQKRFSESSLGSRIEFFDNSLSLVKAHPLLGWGTGGFKTAYEHLQLDHETLMTDNPHNEYIRVSVEWGLIGLLVLFSVFWRQWQLYQNLSNEYAPLAKGIFISFVIGCIANSWLIDFTECFFYVLMSSAFLAQCPKRQPAPALIRAYH